MGKCPSTDFKKLSTNQMYFIVDLTEYSLDTKLCLSKLICLVLTEQ